MEKFVKGEIVIIPFPFTNLYTFKKRPALVISDIDKKDFILCQITSKSKDDDYSVLLKNEDFLDGKLPLLSYIRPNRLFTADKSLVIRKAGLINSKKISEVINKLIEIIK